MKADLMFYVAEDPKQPGAAFASCVDDPDYPKDTARDVSDWIKRGANVLRVDGDTARTMLKKWKRPQPVLSPAPTGDK